MNSSLGIIVLASSLLLSSAGALEAQDSELEMMLREEAERLSGWGHVPEFVRATREQNAKKMSMKAIRAADLAWIYATAETARMRALLNNECAWKLKKLVAGDDSRREAMVMDDRGVLVCASGRTSDYWQGDENKWLKAFADGRGAIHVAEPEFDRSAGAVLVQISAPVLDGEETIGVITVGLDFDLLKERFNLR